MNPTIMSIFTFVPEQFAYKVLRFNDMQNYISKSLNKMAETTSGNHINQNSATMAGRGLI